MAEDISLHSSIALTSPPFAHLLAFLSFSLHLLSLPQRRRRRTYPRGPAPPDLSALCDRGKAGLSRCLYINTHTCVRACARAHKHAPCARSSLRSQLKPSLELLLSGDQGRANDTQLSVLKTGEGRREGRKGRDERRAKGIQRSPPNFCLSCAPAHSYAGSVFCSTSGLFLFPGEERRKKKKRDWSSHDIIRVNGLPW